MFNSSEKADGSYEIGGAEGVYTHPEPNKESLIIYGPITEDITLYVSVNQFRPHHISGNCNGSKLAGAINFVTKLAAICRSL